MSNGKQFEVLGSNRTLSIATVRSADEHTQTARWGLSAVLASLPLTVGESAWSPGGTGSPCRQPQSFIWAVPSLIPAMDSVLPMSLKGSVLWNSFWIHTCLVMVLLSWDCWLNLGDLSWKIQPLFGFLASSFILLCSLILETPSPTSSLCFP